MTRLIGPDESCRLVYLPNGTARAQGSPAPLYSDAAGTTPADVLTLGDGAISDSTVLVDTYSKIPLVQYPDGIDVIYTSVNGGPVVPLYARTDDRLDAMEAAAVLLPAATGTDDTAAINAVLASSSGLVVKGRPGGSYLTSAPLVIKSGTTLDVTGCTITLKTGSNCRMIQNAAFSAARSVSGCATTASSTTVTGPASSFVVDDVGKAVRVWYPDGQYLDTTIAAYVSATQVTLTAAPAYTMTACVVCIGPRDTDIAVIGGNWIRLLNGDPPLTGPGDTTLNSMVFRRVDGLTVRPATFATTSGKYAISLADCSQFLVSGIRMLDTSSDGVHMSGACFEGVVERITGKTRDDMVAITVNDTAAGYGWTSDVDGPVAGITIRDCCNGMAGNATPNTVAVYGDLGGTYALSNIKISRCAAADPFYARAVWLANGGTAISVDDTRGWVHIGSQATSTNVFTGLSIRNTRLLYVTGGPTAAVFFETCTVADAAVDGAVVVGTGGYPVTVAGTIVTGQLRVRNVSVTHNGGIACVYLYNAANVTHLIVEACNRDGVDYTSGRFIDNATGITLGRVSVIDCRATRCLYALNLASSGAMAVHIAGSRIEGTNSIRINTAAARVYATTTEFGGSLAKVNSATIASNDLGLRCDVSALTQAANDMAYNTNAALGCGVGPVVSNGTLWKHLYTGATS